MSLFRPEAKAALWRWREVLTGGGLALIGLYWGLTTFGVLKWIGWVLVAVGAALIFAGLQRVRFRGASGGAGIVQVVEGQISYFGPLTGGVVALTELAGLALNPREKPAAWVLSQHGQPDVLIPVDAEGADALFDVFSALPGMKTERMLSALRSEGADPIVIWRRAASAPLNRRLH